MRHISKSSLLAILLTAGCMTGVVVEGLGDNSSEYANDNECDDPRFKGEGMASVLSQENTGRDASDCGRMLTAGLIAQVRSKEQSSPAECSEIDFGLNRNDWARNGVCDDPRFTGPGVDEVLRQEELLRDASDCRRLCNAGRIWLK
ncbi:MULTISPECIES: hypothetical protein [Rhodobacterales]|uniref:hypothetical protein n=1 Tax=Rhodobacterales TaxID=204455 RepID=UPI0011BEF131|nr:MULTISPECIES: hypothetical protein [Rhodobacterales]MDO6592070.1 hypothetical protein [Yoonia sp. 1_MG-2023]